MRRRRLDRRTVTRLAAATVLLMGVGAASAATSGAAVIPAVAPIAATAAAAPTPSLPAAAQPAVAPATADDPGISVSRSAQTTTGCPPSKGVCTVVGPADGPAATVASVQKSRAARATAAKAAVVVPGPTECAFTEENFGTSIVRYDINRFETCTQRSLKLAAVDPDTKRVLGSQTINFNEWFKTSGTSLQLVHGIALESLTGVDSLAAGGMALTAAFPCPTTAPSGQGCSTTSTGLAVDIAAMSLHGTSSTSWYETMKMGTSSSSQRLLFGDTLSFGIRAPGALPGTVSVPGQDEFLCDSGQAPLTGVGCVNGDYVPDVVFDDTSNANLTPIVHHIRVAQDTLPTHPGKKGSGPAFVRLDTSSAEAVANRKRSCDNNPKYVADAAPGVTANTIPTCDEYPFASAQQPSGGAYSALPVPKVSNDSQGATLKNSLQASRVRLGDSYWVKAVILAPRTGSVLANSTLTNQFNAYSNGASCADWSGGDATNSVLLPNGKRAWFFSDSYLGSPAARRNVFGFSSLHNSIVVQDGASMRTITGGNTCQESNQNLDFWDRYAKTPAAPDTGFYWTGDQQVVGSNVVKFYYHGVPDGDSWVNDYGAVATIPASQFDNSTMTVTPTKLSCATGPPALWGTMTVKWKGDWYIYGMDAAIGHRLFLAKASAANLTNFGAWSFYTGSDLKQGTATWSSSCGAAAALPIGGNISGGSVSNFDDTLYLTMDDYDNVNVYSAGVISTHPSATPWGFSARSIPLYRPPEGHRDYPYWYLVYEARIQQGLTSGSNLVMSYNVNSTSVNTGCNDANNWDASIYRPRFVSLPPSWFNNYDAPFITIPSARTAAPGAVDGPGSLSTRPLLTNPARPGQAGVVKSAAVIAGSAATAASAAKVATTTAPAVTGLASATSIGGATDWYDKWSGCPDVAAAANFKATAKTDGSVDMTWSTVGSDIWTYLYQCDSTTTTCSTGSSCTSDSYGGFTKQLGDLWLTVRSINYRPVADTATNGHTFVWYVCSSGMRSSKGGPSAHQTATVTVPKPSAPTGLSGTRTTATSVTLKWNEVTYPTTGNYLVPYYWDITAGQTSANAVFGSAVVGGTSLTVPNLVSGHKYGFYLVARNFVGDSGTSNVIQNI